MRAPGTFTDLFPPTRWDVEPGAESLTGLTEKLRKVKEEVDETEEAINALDAEHALEEALDVMVAASGLVHRLSRYLGTTPDDALAMVTQKNRARGYYPEG